MIKRIKARWQAWLDGVTQPVYEEKASAAEPGFFSRAADPVTAALPRVRPVHNTAPLVLRELRREVAMEQEVARSYEEMGPITAELLRDLDQTFSSLLSEALAARTAAQARREGQDTWRRVMTERRSARNQSRVLVDVEHLWREEGPEEDRVRALASGIVARAMHASDPDAPTGLIPVMAGPSHMIEEEDTA
jgi:hypothetical protein